MNERDVKRKEQETNAFEKKVTTLICLNIKVE